MLQGEDLSKVAVYDSKRRKYDFAISVAKGRKTKDSIKSWRNRSAWSCSSRCRAKIVFI
jgi:hypothetical protein